MPSQEIRTHPGGGGGGDFPVPLEESQMTITHSLYLYRHPETSVTPG